MDGPARARAAPPDSWSPAMRPSLPLLLLLLAVPLAACTVAQLAVAPELAGGPEPLAVTGANPRTWNQPLGFGPFRTSANRDGTELSWAFEAFGIGAGGASRPYGFRLADAAGGGELEVACHTRELRLFRGSFEVDVTAAFRPALACAIRPAVAVPALGGGAVAAPALLTLAVKAQDYRGELGLAGGAPLEVRSVHRFAGSSLRNPEPVGYELARGGRVLAAVETVNRGRVWLSPDLAGEERRQVASAAAALLLFGGGEV